MNIYIRYILVHFGKEKKVILAERASIWHPIHSSHYHTEEMVSAQEFYRKKYRKKWIRPTVRLK